MEQTSECPEKATDGPPPLLSARQVLALCLLCSLALIPGFRFIRLAALEVSQYQVSTFESYAREAIAAGRHQRAIEFCTGALKSGVYQSDYWGRAYALRAQAYAGMNRLPQALSELEAAAAFWTRRYFYATEDYRTETESFGQTLGRRFLEAGDAESALRAFSAAGMAGGRPVEFLYALAESLLPEEQATLWGAGEAPRLLINNFRNADTAIFAQVVEEQGRTLIASSLDPIEKRQGSGASLIELSASQQEGRSWYAVDTYIPLSERPFALRVHLKERPQVSASVVLWYWFESARQSATTTDSAAAEDKEGWKRYAIERDFYEERLVEADEKGYSVADGFINKIGISLPSGPAVSIWVSGLELCLPNAQ